MTGPHAQPTPTDPESEAVRADPARPTGPAGAEAVRAGAARTPAADTITVVNPRRLLFRLGAVVVVVVVAVLGYVAIFARSDAMAARVGDCVSISGSGSDAHARRVACSDSTALYVVTATGRTPACDPSEVTYTGSLLDRTKLCLFYNLRVGECLTVTRGGDGESKDGCAPGRLKVVYVDASTADQTKCPAEADIARTDETRTRLVCFVTVH
ncbi:MAG: hypothetical protein HY829_10070 [Actinobacteria bacterium]|nr:hypothetical protein [Actinomycetota bacterium]